MSGKPVLYSMDRGGKTMNLRTNNRREQLWAEFCWIKEKVVHTFAGMVKTPAPEGGLLFDRIRLQRVFLHLGFPHHH